MVENSFDSRSNTVQIERRQQHEILRTEYVAATPFFKRNLYGIMSGELMVATPL
jgi:hypothetical protein